MGVVRTNDDVCLNSRVDLSVIEVGWVGEVGICAVDGLGRLGATTKWGNK